MPRTEQEVIAANVLEDVCEGKIPYGSDLPGLSEREAGIFWLAWGGALSVASGLLDNLSSALDHSPRGLPRIEQGSIVPMESCQN